MGVWPQPLDPVRLERALNRLLRHCELIGRMTANVEERAVARARLEQKLGPELTRQLLSSLASASTV